MEGGGLPASGASPAKRKRTCATFWRRPGKWHGRPARGLAVHGRDAHATQGRIRWRAGRSCAMVMAMKNFFISLLGTLAGLMLFTAGLIGLACVGIAVAVSGSTHGGGKPSATVEPGSYLVFNLNANLIDTPPDVDSSGLVALFAGGENGPATLQVRTVTRALQAAAKDDRIAGVFLTGDSRRTAWAPATPPSRRCGPRSWRSRPRQARLAQLELADTRDYYLAAGADEIALDPYGAVSMPGLASQPMFFRRRLREIRRRRPGHPGRQVQVGRRTVHPPGHEPRKPRTTSKAARRPLAGTAGRRRGGPGVEARRPPGVGGLRGPHPGRRGAEGRPGDKLAHRDEVLADSRSAPAARAPTSPSSRWSRRLRRPAGRENSRRVRQPGGPGLCRGHIVDGEGAAGEVGGEKFARELAGCARTPASRPSCCG